MEKKTNEEMISSVHYYLIFYPRTILESRAYDPVEYLVAAFWLDGLGKRRLEGNWMSWRYMSVC
jgi:hypothetical protein